MPTRTIIAALVILLIGAALLVWGLYWRSEALDARAQAQRCSDGVKQLQRDGDAAKRRSRSLLAEARRDNASSLAEAARLEHLIAHAPANASCDDAWSAIENNAAGSPR